MINKDPIEVSEEIVALMKPGEQKEVKLFIEELDSAYKTRSHLAYDKFSVSLATKDGKTGLVFIGVRRENKDETAKRVAIEEDKQKRVEDAELREYLRLRKKYGKGE